MAYTFKTYLYNEKLTKEQNLIMDKLYKLRMSGMAEALEQQLLDPNSRLDSFEDRFSDIANFEWSQRESKKFNRLLKQATLKYPAADLDNSIYEPERQLNTHVIEKLATCEWIDEPNNLLMTGGAGRVRLTWLVLYSLLQCIRCVPQNISGRITFSRNQSMHVRKTTIMSIPIGWLPMIF